MESEIDEYKLNSDDRKQTLKISIINNQQILMILLNEVTNQKYKAIISLSQLKQSSKAFLSTQTLKEALIILKNTIESGKIMITEDLKNNIIEIKYNISLASGETEFDINLVLDENINYNNIQELPLAFDYQGNKEVEEKYGNMTKSTTEYANNIIKQNIKPPIVELEYIEPILQVHYPDGTTKSTALPPRIQEVNGKMHNITEEQFKSIKDYFLSTNNNSSLHRSNSVAKDLTLNSTENLAESLINNNNNNNGEINKYHNIVRPAITSKNLNQTSSFLNSERNTYNYNINKVDNFNNTFNSKFSTNYSSLTTQPKAFGTNNSNYIPQTHNPNIYSEGNNFNLSQTQKYNNNNNIVERRPRMINLKTDINKDPKDNNRSLSLPGQNFNKFNQNKSKYQPNLTNNNYQTNKVYGDNDNKYPFDRNTQRVRINSNLNSDLERKTQNNVSPFRACSTKQIQDNLTSIQLRQQKVQKIQQKLAQIKQRQLEFQQKNIKNYQPQSRLLNNQKQQPQSFRDQNQIRQVQTYTNQQQQFGHQSSHEIKTVRSEMFSHYGNPLKTQTSSPIPSNLVQNKLKKAISREQITLAEMASLKNGANPNYSNLEAITLPNQENEIQNNGEVQEMPIRQEKERILQGGQYQGIENAEQLNEGDQQQEDINIEALFMTEEGRVIFRNGLLRGIIHRYSEIDDVVSKIQDLLLKGVKFHLVYRAFEVGDKAQTFHEKCDKLNMSLILIETDKDIRFGGFTTQSWGGNCLKKCDNNAFIFSLDTNKIYEVNQNEAAVGCYPNFGPIFFGCQIQIFDNFFIKGGITCHKGLNYCTNEDYELNNGEPKFMVKDIEVYSIETIDID